MDNLLHEFRYALRVLAKSPIFAAAAILTLALGIGANTTIFSLVNALLWKDVPAIDMDGLVAVYTTRNENPGVSSYMDYVDLRDQNEVFSGLLCFKERLMDFSTGGVPERIEGMMVTANYFEVLGVWPAEGRFFVPEEDSVPEGHAVAVLSHSLWQSRFASNLRVIGREVALNGRAFTVIGVAPAGFRGARLLDRPRIFVPMMMQPHFMPASGNLLDNRGWGGTFMAGRLREGVSTETARAQLTAIGERLAAEYPRTNANRQFTAVDLRLDTLGPDGRAQAVRVSVLLLGVVVLVLLIACVNVANLLLARASRRRREIAVRQAIGASRGRLVRQLLVESLLLSLAGGGLGLLLAVWGADSLRLVELPIALDFRLDTRVLLFTLAVSVLTSLVFGLVPAWKTARVEVAPALKKEPGSVDGRSRFRLGQALVSGQVALSLVLLVAAGLVTRTLVRMSSHDPGFETAGTLVATIDPSLQGYPQDRIGPFYEELMERLGALPGVEHASRVNGLPGRMNDNVLSFQIEGYQSSDGTVPSFGAGIVGRDYFKTLGISIDEGRAFTSTDRADSLPVVVVNQAADRYLRELTGRGALGQQLISSGRTAEIVGVATDVQLLSVRDEIYPYIYLLHPQVPGMDFGSRMTLLLRTAGDPLAVLPSVRSELAALDANLPLVDPGTLEEHLSGLLSQERMITVLLSLAAALALVLAAIGLYGVLAYSVSRRRRELGLRMALGAHQKDVLALVVRHGLKLTLGGLVLGLFTSLAAGRLLSGFLYDTSPMDVMTLATVSVLLLAVALIASYLPARGATRVDPLSALRQE